MKTNMLAILFLMLLSTGLNAQKPLKGGIEEAKKLGTCFGVFLERRKRQMPDLSWHTQKDIDEALRRHSVIGNKAKKSCIDSQDFNSCVEKNVSKYEYAWFEGFTSSTRAINSPQDPQRLPNIEVVSSLCLR